MRSTLNIPNKINVGYQKRSDTYTGKLAYIIYYDQKGKLRKEISWQGWRDKKIDNEEFDNEPMTGFVLNKKVGDYRSSWGGRCAHIRVYDPRGFEFEIGVDNLIFILEQYSSIKGKGIEGEFVYAWSGTELILLPTCCEEYQESLDFCALQIKKVTKKDMTEGCIYIAKDQDKLLYLGRHPWFQVEVKYGGSYKDRYIATGSEKFHVFRILDGDKEYGANSARAYRLEKGFTKLAEKPDDKPSPLYAKMYQEFKASPFAAKKKEVIFKKARRPRESVIDERARYEKTFLRKLGEDYFVFHVDKGYHNKLLRFSQSTGKIEIGKDRVSIPRLPSGSSYYYGGRHDYTHNLEELSDMSLFQMYVVAENGSETRISL